METPESPTKQCSRCRSVKSIDEFHRDSRKTDGRLCHCKACAAGLYQKNRDRIRAKQNSHYYATRDDRKDHVVKKDRQYRIANKERLNAQKAEYARLNRPKIEAGNAVQSAIACGRMVKMPCEICGKEKAEAHHDDYSRPLDVRWLCRSHHMQWHRKNGEGANGRHIIAATEGKT